MRTKIVFEKKILFVFMEMISIIFSFSFVFVTSVAFFVGVLNKTLSLIYILFLLAALVIFLFVIKFKFLSFYRVVVTEDFLECYGYFSIEKVKWENILDIDCRTNQKFELQESYFDSGCYVMIKLSDPKGGWIKLDDLRWYDSSPIKDENLHAVLTEEWEKHKPPDPEVLFDKKFRMKHSIKSENSSESAK